MTRYDRYFLGVMAQSVLLVSALIATIFVVVDVLLNLDEFQRFENVARDVALYYAFNLPPILYLLFPLIVVGSGLFALARIIRSRELLVLQASGVGPRRALAALFAGALVLALAGLALRELALPPLNAAQRESPVGAYEFRKGKRLTVRDDQGHAWFVRRYDLNAGLLQGVRILSADGRTLVVAEEMTWSSGRGEWFAPRGEIHDLAALLEQAGAKAPAREFSGRPPIGEMLPADFARRKRGFAGTPVSELFTQASRRPDYRELGVALWHELWHPLGGLLMLLVGAGLILSAPARPFGAGALALASILAYQISLFWFETLATAGAMAPALGAALAPVLASLAAAILWARK
ncbi:MAG: hypothetical protein BroJett014_00540 [Planctomycetota bacterium]|nr:hypothetical protein [Planctomycetota bacterium]GIK51081.1 MAG: hypothetical protein BroJett014_00540 [Planctomycetota bacterium]